MLSATHGTQKNDVYSEWIRVKDAVKVEIDVTSSTFSSERTIPAVSEKITQRVGTEPLPFFIFDSFHSL